MPIDKTPGQKSIVIIDNYDSFTYNLVQLIESLVDEPIAIYKNDKFDLDEIEAYEYIILSPGPGLPSESGLLLPLLARYSQSKKILGVCLGLQAIVENYGGQLMQLPQVRHGRKDTMIRTLADGMLLRGLPYIFEAGRYHSWIADEQSLDKDIYITARDKENNIMALEHSYDKVYGVQFHPESYMTEGGKVMLQNFLNII